MPKNVVFWEKLEFLKISKSRDSFFWIPRPKIHRNPFTDLKKVENADRWSFLKFRPRQKQPHSKGDIKVRRQFFQR